jgi:hypothetical protein
MPSALNAPDSFPTVDALIFGDGSPDANQIDRGTVRVLLHRDRPMVTVTVDSDRLGQHVTMQLDESFDDVDVDELAAIRDWALAFADRAEQVRLDKVMMRAEQLDGDVVEQSQAPDPEALRLALLLSSTITEKTVVGGLAHTHRPRGSLDAADVTHVHPIFGHGLVGPIIEHTHDATGWHQIGPSDVTTEDAAPVDGPPPAAD